MSFARSSAPHAFGAVLVLVTLALGACRSRASGDPPRALAIVEGLDGCQLSGLAAFTERPDGVSLSLDVQYAPSGLHGVHLAESGNCFASLGMPGGGHFNPDKLAHGGPESSARHAGDFGNVTVDQNGMGHLERFCPGLTVQPGPRSVIGRALTISERADDFATQPAGDSGRRIACGVVVPTD